MASAAPPPQQHDDVTEWTERIKDALGDTSKITAPRQAAAPWHTSLFGCFDPIDTCLITCCCPCVTFGKTHHRLRKDPNLVGYSPVNVSCLGFWASTYCCLHIIPQLLQKHDIKEKFNLDGDFATDCLKSWCCACCDIIQQDKEAEYQLANAQMPLQQQPGLKEGMSMQQSPLVQTQPYQDPVA